MTTKVSNKVYVATKAQMHSIAHEIKSIEGVLSSQAKAKSAFIRSKFFKFYIVFTTILSILEPIFCGLTPLEVGVYPNYNTFYSLQIATLAASSFFYILGMLIAAIYVELDNTKSNLSYYGKLQFVFNNEGIFEFLCFTWGWACLFTADGLGMLRCFRVFRVIYYLEEEGRGNATRAEDDRAPNTKIISLQKLCYITLGMVNTL